MILMVRMIMIPGNIGCMHMQFSHFMSRRLIVRARQYADSEEQEGENE